MHDSALRLAVGIGYENAGTVEFVYDAQREEFYFLEMNTRIQVEHPVTECVTGIDLVQWQLLVAGGAPLPLTQDQIVVQGHAVECRLGAEDPNQGFLPSPGRIDVWELPHDDDSVRVDTHCFRGYIVPAYYDSLLAKIITYGTDRPSALTAMMAALDRSRVEGIHTTLPMLRRLVASPDFLSLNVWTTWVDQLTTAERF